MSRFSLQVLLLASLVSFAGHAAAVEGPPAPGLVAEAPAKRFELALRAGYALVPTGVFDVDGAFPIWVDADYQLSQHWALGVYGEAGIVYQSGVQDSETDATYSGTHLRAGAAVRYHFAPGRHANPWLALGIGYDALRYHASHDSFYGDSAYDVRVSGPELLNAQVGVDLAASSWFAWGPCFSATLVDYLSTNAASGPPHLRSWLTLGLRGSFRL